MGRYYVKVITSPTHQAPRQWLSCKMREQHRKSRQKQSSQLAGPPSWTYATPCAEVVLGPAQFVECQSFASTKDDFGQEQSYFTGRFAFNYQYCPTWPRFKCSKRIYNGKVNHVRRHIWPFHVTVFWRWWPCVHIRLPWPTEGGECRKTRSSRHHNYCRTVHTGIHKCSCLKVEYTYLMTVLFVPFFIDNSKMVRYALYYRFIFGRMINLYDASVSTSGPFY